MEWLNPILRGALIGAVIGAVFGLLCGVVIVVWNAMRADIHCPQCQAIVPRWRTQLKAQGWSSKRRGISSTLICGRCGCEMTAAGKKVNTT
jgi:hypothetical protein